MERIRVEAVQSYDVIIERNLIPQAADWITGLFDEGECPYHKVAVVSDDLAGAIYGRKVLKSLRAAGFEAKLFTFPNGEESKNSRVLERIYEFLIQFGLARKDLIIALGGGVTGDMAGFAAATYLRGVDYVQIPTTLIAQTDSSVGGKTAIDTPFGKNLIGAFHQPRLVLCDIDALSTLPQHIFNEGMGEVIKYALLSKEKMCGPAGVSDLDLFSLLEQEDVDHYLDQIVSRCVRIKAEIVKRDEFEQGDRMLLNLGHTIGHAVERASNFTVRHGAAVGIGLAVMARACVRNGILEAAVEQRLLELLDRFELPKSYSDKTLSELADLAGTDKKRDSGGIHVVLCHGIGDCKISHMTMGALADFLNGVQQ